MLLKFIELSRKCAKRSDIPGVIHSVRMKSVLPLLRVPSFRWRTSGSSVARLTRRVRRRGSAVYQVFRSGEDFWQLYLATVALGFKPIWTIQMLVFN